MRKESLAKQPPKMSDHEPSGFLMSGNATFLPNSQMQSFGQPCISQQLFSPDSKTTSWNDCGTLSHLHLTRQEKT